MKRDLGRLLRAGLAVARASLSEGSSIVSNPSRAALRTWREVRSRDLVRGYQALLSESPWSWPERAARQASSDSRATRPVAVGFGARHWEQHGLWQAWEAASDFSLFDYTANDGADLAMEELGRRFEDFVDAVERRAGRVDVAYFYAAGRFVDPAMVRRLRQRGVRTALMGLDDKSQFVFERESQLAAAQAVDAYWTTWRSGQGWLASQGVRPWHAPEAASPEFYRPLDGAPRDIQVLWIGRRYGPREDLVEFLTSRGFAVEARGPGWPAGPVPHEELLATVARTQVVLGMGGIGPTEDMKHIKGRDFEIPMCGAVYLTSFNPELADHFDIGREILCYSSFTEAEEVLRWILADSERADQIRRCARERCLRMHTWEHRISALLSQLFPR